MAYTEVDTGTYAGSGSTIKCEQGPLLTPSAGAITVTDSFHSINGGTLSTIHGGTPNSLYVLQAAAQVSIGSTTNINTIRQYIPTGDCVALWFDGTTYNDLQSSDSLTLANASGLVSIDGAGTGLLGLIFADASNFVHLAYYGTAGMYVPTPNTSFGRAAIPIAHVIEYIGAGQNAAAGAYDLTSADGVGDLVGLACYPVMRLTAHGTNHYAAKFWPRSLDDGTARTVDTQIGINILAGDKGSNTTVTTMVGLDIDEPTNGAANYGIRNSGTSWLKKNVGVGVAPSTTYPLFVHSATDSNFGVTDSTGAVGAVGTLLSSLTDANTLQPMFFNASLFRFFGIVQFGTSLTPQSVAFPSKAVTCANGANTIADGGAGYVRITGPTGAFSVNGFTAGLDGQIKRVFNAVAQPMTITNEATATSAQQISTLTGADVVLRSGKSFASFIYDGANAKWILTGTN